MHHISRSLRRQALWLASATMLGLGSVAMAASPGVSDDTITIGMYGPLTGPQSSWGHPVMNGAEMIYKAVNEQGGIHGRKIKVVREDGACDSAKTLAAVKKLIHREKVFMVNAGICSGPSMAAKPELVANGVPHMLFAASLDAITKPVAHPIFTVAPTGSQDGISIGDFVKTIPNVKRVAVVGHADDWAKSKLDAFKTVADKAGLEIVANETIERNVTDAAAQVLAIKRANADAVVLLTYPGPTAAFLRDAYKYDLKVKFIGNNSLIDLQALAERVGNPDAVQTTYVTATISGPLGSKELAPYEQMLKKYYPSDTPKAESFYGTASAVTIVEALKRAGKDLDREKFISALEQMKDFDAGIAPCRIGFSAENHQGCQTQTIWTLRGNTVTNIGSVWSDK